MGAQVDKRDENQVQVPTLVMPYSLMQLLSQAPSIQSLDDFWCELPKSKSGKIEHKAREHHAEKYVNLPRGERR